MLVSMKWSIINWYKLFVKEWLICHGLHSALNEKILKDRIKPFALVVEESLEQTAHMLSSSAWCLPEQDFYHSFSGTSTDLKWATITVGSWCQFWLGRMRGALAIVSVLCLLKLSEMDGNTGLCGAWRPVRPCWERGEGHRGDGRQCRTDVTLSPAPSGHSRWQQQAQTMFGPQQVQPQMDIKSSAVPCVVLCPFVWRTSPGLRSGEVLSK